MGGGGGGTRHGGDVIKDRHAIGALASSCVEVSVSSPKRVVFVMIHMPVPMPCIVVVVGSLLEGSYRSTR